MTPTQYRLLCDKAKQCGLTKRAFITRFLEDKEIRALPSKEINDLRMEVHKIGVNIKALRTEVHQIGNNINQIARSVNAGIARPEDAKRGLYLLDQVYELMFQLANR